MQIEGYFNHLFDPKAPFLDAIVLSKTAGINRKIRFLIDTGASSTILLDKDVKDLGINISKLKKLRKKVGGIGGSIDTYIIEDAELIFTTKEKSYHKEKTVLYVGFHDLSKLDKDTRKKFLILPSLIGRDILQKYNLHILHTADLVLLEKS